MKTNLWKIAAALFIGAAASVTSCDPVDEDPQDVAPIFPEAVNETIEAGKPYKLTINPNLDWEIKLAGDTEFFELKYNDDVLPRISGKAGSHEITVTAIESDDFEQRKCSLIMTMADVEKTIAEFHRNGKEELFKVYPAVFDEEYEEFEYNDGGLGNKTFAEQESYVIDLRCTEPNYVIETYLKVEANFDWRLKDCPEWVEAVELSGRYATSSKANVPACICLRGLNDKYTNLYALSGELVFVVDEDSENPREVTQKVTLRLNNLNSLLKVQLPESGEFDKGGSYKDPYGMGREFSGSVVGVAGTQVYAVSKDSGNYTVLSAVKVGENPEEAEGSWLHLSLMPENEDDVLKTSGLYFNLDPNTEEARSAEIVIVPAVSQLSDPSVQLFNGDRTEISDNYKVYSTISQEGKVGVSGVISADNDALANYGAMLENADPSDPANSWINAVKGTFANVSLENYYKLTITKQMTPFTFSYTEEEPFADLALYEYGDNGVQMSEDYWAQMSGWDENSRKVSLVVMAADTTARYMLIKGGDYENSHDLAVIFVNYDPNSSIGGGDAFTIEGESDAVLEKMSEMSGNFMMLSSEYGCTTIYELTWDGAPVDLLFSFPCIGIEKPDEWSGEDVSWLQAYLAGEGRVMIYSEAETSKDGTLLFIDENGTPQAILVCHHVIPEE